MLVQFAAARGEKSRPWSRLVIDCRLATAMKADGSETMLVSASSVVARLSPGSFENQVEGAMPSRFIELSQVLSAARMPPAQAMRRRQRTIRHKPLVADFITR